jgi:hypothetical protein
MPGKPDLGNLGAHRGVDNREGALAVPDKHPLARAIDPDIVGILAEIDALDGREILGSNSWTRGDLEQLLQLVASRRLTPIIDKILPLSEGGTAISLLENRAVFR